MLKTGRKNAVYVYEWNGGNENNARIACLPSQYFLKMVI